MPAPVSISRAAYPGVIAVGAVDERDAARVVLESGTGARFRRAGREVSRRCRPATVSLTYVQAGDTPHRASARRREERRVTADYVFCGLGNAGEFPATVRRQDRARQARRRYVRGQNAPREDAGADRRGDLQQRRLGHQLDAVSGRGSGRAHYDWPVVGRDRRRSTARRSRARRRQDQVANDPTTTATQRHVDGLRRTWRARPRSCGRSRRTPLPPASSTALHHHRARPRHDRTRQRIRLRRDQRLRGGEVARAGRVHDSPPRPSPDAGSSTRRPDSSMPQEDIVPDVSSSRRQLSRIDCMSPPARPITTQHA